MNWLTFVKDWLGLVGVVVVAISAVGFSVSAPWPARAEMEAVHKELVVTQQQVKEQGCLILMVLLRSYKDDLEKATLELTSSPSSQSAKRQKQDAEVQVHKIEVHMTKLGC